MGRDLDYVEPFGGKDGIEAEPTNTIEGDVALAECGLMSPLWCCDQTANEFGEAGSQALDCVCNGCLQWLRRSFWANMCP